jgi:DNA-binding transcriptional regulator YiaG
MEASTPSVAATELRAMLGARGIAQRATMTTFDPGREETPPKQRRPRATATTDFGRALTALKIKQRTAARWFHTSERNIRRWKSGTRKTPPGVVILTRLLVAEAISIDQIEAAATNGANSMPAPIVEPAPKQPTTLVAPAPKPPAPVADPGSSIAERVMALVPGKCKWPHGDPRCPDEFWFCGRPAAAQPYCENHTRVAYEAPQTRRGRPASFRLGARY